MLPTVAGEHPCREGVQQWQSRTLLLTAGTTKPFHGCAMAVRMTQATCQHLLQTLLTPALLDNVCLRSKFEYLVCPVLLLQAPGPMHHTANQWGASNPSCSKGA
jgi:hypothetical protein